MPGELAEVESTLAERKRNPTGSLASRLVASPKLASSKFAEDHAFLIKTRLHGDMMPVLAQAPNPRKWLVLLFINF